jgi:hypothetical protein
MIIAVHGSKKFDDYSIFLSGMSKAMFVMDKDDDQIFLYTAGPRRVNEMAMEFANVSERGLKARGVRIQVRKVPSGWIWDNFHFLDFFAYFAVEKEPIPAIVNSAQAKDVQAEVFRFRNVA